MKRWTDKLVALQFLMVGLPVALVLVGQTVADIHRAKALASSSPLESLGHEVRANYKTFQNGVADAVDTGSLGGQAADALTACARRMQALHGDAGARFAETTQTLNELASAVPRNAGIAMLMPLRERIKTGAQQTQQLEDELTAENQAVLQDAILWSNREKILVPAAILVSLLVTATFVVRTQRRLRRRLESEERAASVNLRIKNALDHCTMGIMMTDPERTIVYVNQAAVERLRRATAGMQGAARFNADSLIGTPLSALVDGRFDAADAGSRRNRVELGGRTFFVTGDPVVDQTGRPIGHVLEWADRTEEIALQRQVAEIVAAAGSGDFAQRISMEVTVDHAAAEDDFVTQLVAGINRLLQTSEAGLHDVGRVLEALAQGDLTQRMTHQYAGTFGELKENSSRTITRLQDMVGHIRGATATIDAAVYELFSGSAQLSAHAEKQAARFDETARAMQQLSVTVRTNASDAQEAARFANDAATVAGKGGAVMEQAVTTMGQISEASRRIAQIIGVVDEIAFQTNLLALNAAVEAARAGEQGRGFAVVAAEVRNLAGRSASAAREITQLIKDSVDRVSSGMRLVGSAGETIHEVVGAVEHATRLINRISSASQAQSTDIDKVSAAISEANELTQRTSELVEGSAAAANSLREQAGALVQMVGVFKLDSAGTEPTVTRPQRSLTVVSSQPSRTLVRARGPLQRT